MMGGPLASDNLTPNDFPSRQREQPCGTTSALVSWVHSGGNHHVPTSLRSTVVTRFFATTDALTPTGPFVAACRGSLIHVSLTSDHAVSNHPCCSLSRVPLPLRWGHYFVRASRLDSHARQQHRPNRVHFMAVRLPRRCGLVVLFPLLSTRGYRPDAVTFGYWPCSVGQVRDFHPAVKDRSQAHESRLQPAKRASLSTLTTISTRWSNVTFCRLKPGLQTLRRLIQWQCSQALSSIWRRGRNLPIGVTEILADKLKVINHQLLS